MKVIQLEDQPLLPTPWRIKKVIELEEDLLNITTLITKEHQSQDFKQKQPVKTYPLRHRKADVKTVNCEQEASNYILAQIRNQEVKDTNTNMAKEIEEQLSAKEIASQTCAPLF